MLTPRLALALLPLVLSGATRAESTDVSGIWTVTWDSGIRTQGSRTVEVQRRSTAELVLHQRGDSLEGTWKTEPGGGRQVRGTLAGDTLRLASEPFVVEGRTVRLLLSGRVRGEAITGTMFVQIGDRQPAPRRWEATRRPR